MQWNAQNVDMSQLVESLSGLVGRQVIDKTGVTGRFDVNIEYNRDLAPGDEVAPSINTVLQDELGLKLDSGRAPVEVLVIDYVERPSEN
jgi:uncharacterized protein (TIGR03435 family)